MANLNLIKRVGQTEKTRVGRGGKRGKTSGRGGKGQTARAGHKIRPEVRDMIKKLPKRRGYGVNRSSTVRRDRTVYTVVNIAAFDAKFKKGDVITPAALVAKGLIRGRAPKVKVLGLGELKNAYTIKHCAVSTSAKAAIEKAGGRIHAI